VFFTLLNKIVNIAPIIGRLAVCDEENPRAIKINSVFAQALFALF
jgi:hypothetical protein